MTWILTFIGFAALIILHELGHFTAAKAVGMRVERLAQLFPPQIAQVPRGGTQYGKGGMPLVLTSTGSLVVMLPLPISRNADLSSTVIPSVVLTVMALGISSVSFTRS